MHAQLRHSNIVQLYAAFQEGDQVVLVQVGLGPGAPVPPRNALPCPVLYCTVLNFFSQGWERAQACSGGLGADPGQRPCSMTSAKKKS